MNKILLVDGNALVHRSFHALPPLNSPEGHQVNAVYGFFSILLGALEKLNPSHVFVAFDVAGGTFRNKLYPEYKAKRAKAPQGLYDQIPVIQDMLSKFEIPSIGVKGYEADDVIGTLSQKTQNSKLKTQNKNNVIILTGDKDAYQLINENTSVFTPRKKLNMASIIDKNEFVKLYGFDPKFMGDFKALRGDPSDNIPGVAGIGEKTAQKLISRYQTLENVYDNIGKIALPVRQKLLASRKNAYLSKQLVQIDCDVPLRIDLEEAKIKDFDQNIIERAFLKLGFKSLVKRLPVSIRKIENRIQDKLL